MTAGIEEKTGKDWALVTAGYARLLECWLASYGRLCLLARTPKSELNRHEAVIKEGFQVLSAELAAVRALKPLTYLLLTYLLPARWEHCGRVDEILASMARGDNYDEATQRYFNRLRYGSGKNENAEGPPKDNQ